MSGPGPGGPTGPPPPAAIVLTSEQRGWGTAAHLSAFAGAWVALAFLGPLVVYLLRKDDDPFTAHHAREALNFNLTVLLVTVVGGLIGVIFVVGTLGFGALVLIPAAAAYGLFWIVITIVAGVRAWDGGSYHYPLSIRFVS